MVLVKNREFDWVGVSFLKYPFCEFMDQSKINKQVFNYSVSRFYEYLTVWSLMKQFTREISYFHVLIS